MKRAAILIAALVVLGVSLAVFVGGPPANEKPDICQRIEAAVATASPGDSLKFASVVPITFDLVGVIPPYADNGSTARALGIPWDAKSAPGYSFEKWTELVFVDENQVVGWCAIARTNADFPTLRGPYVVEAPAEFLIRAPEAPLGKALVAVRAGSLAPERRVTFAHAD